MRITKLIIIILFFINGLYAQTYTISGYVVDEETGETVIGVSIVLKNTYKGSITNVNGYFQLSGLDSGRHILQISHISFIKKEIEISVNNKSLVLPDIPIKPKSFDLKEVSIVEIRPDIFSDPKIDISHLKMKAKAIQIIPTARKDVFRAIKYLPGIEGVDPFSPLYSARGGDPGENLVLLDGVTIYNPYHFVSGDGLFNLYAIKDISLLVGGFGAEYGGRNSSILNITTKEGNNKKLHGEVEPTISQTSAVFDFPVSKKSTMMISGRINYNLPYRFLFYSPLYCYDFNVSYNYKINDHNRLRIKYFYSKDYMDYKMSRWWTYLPNTISEFEEIDNYEFISNNNWENQAATAILKTIVNPDIYLTTQVSGSFFNSNDISGIEFDQEIENEGETENIKLFYKTALRNKIQDISARSVLNIRFSNSNILRIGANYSNNSFSNELIINDLDKGKIERNPNIISGFAENKIILDQFTGRLGMRLLRYSYSDGIQLEPRLNFMYNLPFGIKLKAAWGIFHQNIISINSPEYMVVQFLDYYYPLKNKDPSTSIHYIFGFEKSFTQNSFFSIDLYYKNISTTYAFDIGMSESEVYAFSDRIKAGKGTAYGLELLWRGSWNKFSGWLSYGLSKSTRNFPHIMDGQEYLFDYDRPHSFKAIINYQVSPRLSYSGTLIVKSGVPRTIETSSKSFYYYEPINNKISKFPVGIVTSKNNARLPMFLRLDFGLKKQVRKGFAADLVEFLKAENSYLTVSFENILFIRRNVVWYIPYIDKYIPIGMNYIPSVNVGYTIKF